MKKIKSIVLCLLVFTKIVNANIPLTNEALRIALEQLQSFPEKTFYNEKIHAVKSLLEIYQFNEFELIWSQPLDEKLIHHLKSLHKFGLNSSEYHIKTIELLQYKPAEAIIRDLLLTDAFLISCQHLKYGKVNAETYDAEWFIPAKHRREFVNEIQEIIKTQNFNIQAILPSSDNELKLIDYLLKYQKIKQQGGWEILNDEETLKKGSENKNVKLLKKRLFCTNDYAGDTTGNVFNEDLFNAVQRFQKRHGIEADGEVGKKTIDALNVSVDKRIDQIKVNLERLKWLPDDFGNYFIEVNIPNFSLVLFKDGATLWESKVIVGKDFRRTPVFSGEMSYLVLNPTWTVPPGILNADIIPAARKNPEIINTKKLTVYNNQGQQLSLIPFSCPINSSESPCLPVYVLPVI